MADKIVKSITVKTDAATAYRLWSNFQNFPHFMKYVESVTMTGPRTSTWEVAGPLGAKVEWDAETTLMEQNQRIGWNTKDREGVTTSGEVVFAPIGHDETKITVTMQHNAPGGKLGEVIANIFSDPDKRVEEDLYNFKTYAETHQRAWA